jgi:type IV secretion system protein VirB6
LKGDAPAQSAAQPEEVKEMGFFGEFERWLNALLTNYLSNTLATVVTTLRPAVITLAALYVALWGYLQATGAIEQPFIAGLKRIGTIAVVIGVGLQLWLYHEAVVDTFFTAPGQLAAAVVGAGDPVTIVDQILFTGGDAAQALLEKGGLFDGNLAYTLAGYFVYVLIGVTAVYTMFLLCLSRVALSVLLALGPLFFAMLLFDSTRRFFEAWTAQLANYAFITILTVLIVSLLLQLVTTAAAQASAAGAAIQIAQAVRLCLAAGLILLILRQVMPMAAGLARGIALHSYGAVSTAVGWGMEYGADVVGSARRSVAGYLTPAPARTARAAGGFRRREG